MEPASGASLLERFDLQVEQLDYQFVRDCSDRRTLERIVRVLRSGEEGYYPHLISFTEERLSQLFPESRLLQDKLPTLMQDLSPSQSSTLREELSSWCTQMQKEEEDLTRYDVIRAPLPPVRNTNDKENTLSAKSDPKFNSRNEKKEEVLLESGFKYLERGNILQATLQFQKVLTINPMNTRALGAMAAIQKERKQ